MSPQQLQTTLLRTLWAALVVAIVSTVVLGFTGVWLARNYQPGPTRDLGDGRFRWGLGGGWVHETHAWTAIVLTVSVGVAAMALIAWVIARRPRPEGRRAVAASVALAGAAVLGLVTSSGLRWGALGLWAVTIGEDYRGVWGAARSDQVRFILFRGEGEVDPGEYWQRVVAHVFGAPAVLVAAGGLLLFLLWGLRRQARDEVGSS